jgi:hypothetical protein
VIYGAVLIVSYALYVLSKPSRYWVKDYVRLALLVLAGYLLSL